MTKIDRLLSVSLKCSLEYSFSVAYRRKYFFSGVIESIEYALYANAVFAKVASLMIISINCLN